VSREKKSVCQIGPGVALAHLCLLLSVPATAIAGTVTQAVQAPWQVLGDTLQGRLYHRRIEGSSIPEALIETRFDASPARVHALVTDYGHFAEFIPDVAESRVLRRAGDTQWVFHRLHFGGPVTDRVYVIESSDASSRPQLNYYRVDWKLSDRHFPGLEGGAGVRPRSFTGFWELRPSGGGRGTEARYAVHSDPGGLIPDWLVVKMTDRYLQQVVAAVRRRLAETG
jgi:ribosome-associated toxin RatA of RatAB toxin-antitoxin module